MGCGGLSGVGAGGKTAVVLFNLGGPDGQEAVEPFLRNLFGDPAIIGAPAPVRLLLARLLARRRAATARDIYRRLGGASPLLANTREQARALERRLSRHGSVRAFIAMRYWHPLSAETAREVAEWGPDAVVLLPLYPQYSTTTTGSSLAAWQGAAAAARLEAFTRAVCCYPTAPGFVETVAGLVREAVEAAGGVREARVLLTAHGLPERLVARGDPYRWQVERTATAVAAAVDLPGLDWTLCYQSRVGPLKWIGPSTEDEIRRAARDRRAVVMVPVAFVSEHSETLVELDMTYRDLAARCGVPRYVRVSTVGARAPFIDELARLARAALDGGACVASMTGGRLCPKGLGRCPAADATARSA